MSLATAHLPPSVFPSPCIHLTRAPGASGPGPGAAGSCSAGAFTRGRPQSHRNEGGRSWRARGPGLSKSWTVRPSPSSPMARGCMAFTSALVSHGDQREGMRGRDSRSNSERGRFLSWATRQGRRSCPTAIGTQSWREGGDAAAPPSVGQRSGSRQPHVASGSAPALAKQVSGNSPQVRNYRFISTIEANLT